MVIKLSYSTKKKVIYLSRKNLFEFCTFYLTEGHTYELLQFYWSAYCDNPFSFSKYYVDNYILMDTRIFFIKKMLNYKVHS